MLVAGIGVAGDNFSSSMANIGFFFPKANEGLALGINAAGKEVYIQNVCFVRAIPTVLTLVLIRMFMDNLPLPKQSPKSMLSIFGNKHTWFMT